MTDRVKVVVCVPARDMVHAPFAYDLCMAMCYVTKHHPNVDLRLQWGNGTLLPEQRTALSRVALDEGASWVVFFDSDMTFPVDVIEKLLRHKKPIVAANYSTRKWPHIQPVTFKSDDSQDRVYTREDSPVLEEVAAAGFGVIAIHRVVFERTEQPWFYTPFDVKRGRYDCGEDIWFCRRAREYGFPVFIDHELSRQVGHVGSREWTYKDALEQENSPAVDEARKAAQGDLGVIVQTSDAA